jgi:uncharacterized Zn finger protein
MPRRWPVGPTGSHRWDRWNMPQSVPIPADGIKARSRRGAIGETWWSRRFIDLLESFELGGRLARGKRYARTGQVLSLELGPGLVAASVQGSRSRPYQVTISVATLTDAEWDRVTRAMAAKAVWLAKLLAGDMPMDIDEVFAGCSLSLFPPSADSLMTACSCPDWSNPCKHIAATYYLLAESFDDNPWLIFAWRGRGKDALLAALRADEDADEDEQVALGDLEGWPALDAPSQSPTDLTDRWWRAGPALAQVSVQPRAAEVPDAILRPLDPVDVRIRRENLVDALRPCYHAMVRDFAGEHVPAGSGLVAGE